MKNRHRSIFYIELIIEGQQIKRFINMCRKDDITFIHIQYDREHKDRIIVRMSRNDVLKMKKNIRATQSYKDYKEKLSTVLYIQISWTLFFSGRHYNYVYMP